MSETNGKLDYRNWITQVDIVTNSIIKSKSYFNKLYTSDTIIKLNFEQYQQHREDLKENELKLNNLLNLGKTYNFKIPSFFVEQYDLKVGNTFSKHNKEIINLGNDFRNK